MRFSQFIDLALVILLIAILTLALTGTLTLAVVEGKVYGALALDRGRGDSI
jgi:hypothetical protein